jgi:hypothetical protein
MRCPIVASGTRNARAISGVVRPPTARSVSASCDDGDSDGWQQRNSSVSVSSDRDQPRARMLGHTLGRPLQRGGQQRLLHGVLACVELAVAAQQDAEDLRRKPAQEALDAFRRHGEVSPPSRRRP